MNSYEKAELLAKNILNEMIEQQKELVRKMILAGKHPDDWVIVDNYDEVVNQIKNGETPVYKCEAKFLLKKDRK